jgi:hypothetical protein
MPHTSTYTDGTGQEWRVREIVRYAETLAPTGVPKVVRAAIIFELAGARLIADNAPLDWCAHPDMLEELFARARLPSTEYW